MTTRLQLVDLRSVRYSEWVSQKTSPSTRRLCFATSGYERRAKSWVERTIRHFPRREGFTFYVAAFQDFPNALSRATNDRFYRSAGIPMHDCGSSREIAFLRCVEEELTNLFEKANGDAVQIHFDYSCMPRRWYCALPSVVSGRLRPQDQAFFWYTPGKYDETNYPTAGTSDFAVFSGRPSLGSSSRTHLFGLGFDRIRSQAIWSVLDPHNLICFYADPAAQPSYVERVERDNREALNAAAYTFTIPLDDFAVAFSKLVSVVNQFRTAGDVVIVPDGPKPLVLASSLVPLVREEPTGVVCFHVAKRQSENFTPVDVPELSEPVGFSIAGPVASANEQK